MKIILLAGNANTGKTTTLNLVYVDLAKQMKNPPPKKKIIGGSRNDFESSPLIYKGKKIAIFSMGDYQASFFEAVIKYCAIVDVLIIPCRTNNAWANRLVRIIQKYSQHCLIQKTVNDKADCKKIIASI
jgi:Flp pilus assembly CpaF family ATPase